MFLVMSRQGESTLPLVVTPGYIATFSTALKAVAYMFVRGDTNWQMSMITRSNFDVDAKVLKSLGLKGLCLDPSTNSHGTLINFDDIHMQDLKA